MPQSAKRRRYADEIETALLKKQNSVEYHALLGAYLHMVSILPHLSGSWCTKPVGYCHKIGTIADGQYAMLDS